MVNPFGVEDVSKFAVNRESIKTAADIGRKGRGLKRGTDEADKTLDSVKQAKKDMHKLLRPIASMSQYPGRWGAGAGGTAVAGYGGYKVRKSDDTSAFGVEHVSKAMFKPKKMSLSSALYGVKTPNKLTVRSGGPGHMKIDEISGSGRKWVDVNDTYTQMNNRLNRAGAQARRKVHRRAGR